MTTYQITIEQVFGQVMTSCVMTDSDREVIKSTILDENLSKEEKAIINRILYNVRRGFVRLLN